MISKTEEINYFLFQNRKDSQITISASYLELYKDDIIDLLDVNDKDLDVRDDAAGNTGEENSAFVLN